MNTNTEKTEMAPEGVAAEFELMNAVTTDEFALLLGLGQQLRSSALPVGKSRGEITAEIDQISDRILVRVRSKAARNATVTSALMH